jgi:hypothetical protein
MQFERATYAAFINSGSATSAFPVTLEYLPLAFTRMVALELFKQANVAALAFSSIGAAPSGLNADRGLANP